MSRPGWKLQSPALLALVVAVPLVSATAPGRTRWKLGSFTWVQRVPAEPGAPANTHPASLGAEAIQSALAPVRARVDGKDVPLFGKDELKDLSTALSEALALAQPSEDLILLSTSRHGGGFLERAEGLTARLFVRNGALNLIVHDARLEFMDRYLGDNLEPNFAYGSRKTASRERLQAPQATGLRDDWLTLPLPVAVAPEPAPVATTAPVLAPAPTAPPKPTLSPAPMARDAAFFEAQTQRLKALRRLRDENLISETEYQEKREAILKTL